MGTHNNRAIKYFLSRSKLVLVLAFFLFLNINFASAGNLSGWAWSENIGWISLSSNNQGAATAYGVDVAANGAMSGFAWSENIGWISFNSTDVIGCPTNPCAPTLNTSTGVVDGWARACAGTINGNCTGGSRTDGWDGWIHLRRDSDADGIINTDIGVAASDYGVFVVGCNWDGWAWGSDVVGWIHFRKTTAPAYGVVGTGNGCANVFSADIKANGSDAPPPIAFNTAAMLSWTSAGADSCSVSPGGWTGTSNAGQTTGNLTSNVTYTLTCLKAGFPNVTDQVTVNQTCGNGIIDVGDENCDFNLTGLVGWWKFNDGFGNSAIDSSVTSNNGIVGGNPAWVSGKWGGALQFDGVNNKYVQVPTNALYDSPSLTISLWFNIVGNPSFNSHSLLEKGDGLDQNGYWLEFTRTDNASNPQQIGFGVASGGVSSGIFSNNGPISLNVWHNAVVTTTVGGNASIYIDGFLRNSGTNLIRAITTTPLTIGTEDFEDGILGNCCWTNGSIDDVQIYNRILSAQEIREIYTAGLPSNVGSATCQSVGPYSGGTLSCSSTCFYDVNQCIAAPSSQCSDGLNNDNDFAANGITPLIDYGVSSTNDPGCSSGLDNDERNQCTDILDNDSDGLIDTADPGCHTDGNSSNPSSYNPQGNSEGNKLFREF